MTPTNRDGVPHCVYRPQENLGACYRSVVYNDAKWIKADKRENSMFETGKTGWKYRSSRSLLITTLYEMHIPQYVL